MNPLLKLVSAIVIIIFFFQIESCSPEQSLEVNILPSPQKVNLGNGQLSLKNGFQIESQDISLNKLISIIDDDFFKLSGFSNQKNSTDNSPKVILSIDKNLKSDAYHLDISEKIKIAGGSYQAVSNGAVSFLQLLDKQLNVPKVHFKDSPRLQYRSLMIDCARGFHSIETLQQIIELCKWYKINYLHLHLTDDQSFTFQSDYFPALATDGRSYSKTELKNLNQYAFDRGVILVPELDVPGHASPFVGKMPALFGIGNPSENSYTISMGKEEIYEALEKIIEELAEVFSHSPYIHIGGDEAHFAGMENDAETKNYMKKNNIPTIKELFRHFLVRLNESVKKTGKQTMVWAGFSPKGEIEIPKDIIVILWESQYYDPHKLIKTGHPVINASFKPLYVVNNRKWDAKYIYEHWNERRWESWATPKDTFAGTEVEKSDAIWGATMCAWEQSQLVQIPRLRDRLAAMSEKLWTNEISNHASFQKKWENTNAKFSKILHPFSIEESNMKYPDFSKSNFYEHMQFEKEMKLEVKPFFPNLKIRYELGDKNVTAESPIYTQPILIDSTVAVKIQAFDVNENKVGFPFSNKYIHAPVMALKTNLEKELLPNSWDKMRFQDSLTIHLQSTGNDEKIEYVLNSNSMKDSSAIYSEPIKVTETTHLRAYLLDKNGKTKGSTLSESYYLLEEKTCLTTGKKIIASNEANNPGGAKKANNGRVTLWEQWGDHNNGNNWLKVDLEKEETISKLVVHNFWDNWRYYQYTIEGSLDGEKWETLVDFSENEIKASFEGYHHKIEPKQARFLKLNVLFNSANPGLHVVEFCAY